MDDSIGPFFGIWIEPRQTIRRIVDSDPRRNVIALALIGGGLGSLESAWFTALGNPASIGPLWPIGVALRVAFGAVWGVIGLYFGAWLLGLFCRLLGGIASQLQMRAALAWASIPDITATFLSVTAVVAGIFDPPHFHHGRMPTMTGSTVELGLFNAVFVLWGLVIQMKCVGEVNRFSAWRALGAVLLMAAVIVALVLALVFIAEIGLPHRARH